VLSELQLLCEICESRSSYLLEVENTARAISFSLFGLVVALSADCQRIRLSGMPGSPLRARYYSFLARFGDTLQ
jgi:hypothetical protein